MKNIVVLGSTGSIGEQTLQVACEFPDRLKIAGLAARRNLNRLLEQTQEHRPRWVALVDKVVDAPADIRRGSEALIDMVVHPEVDLVVVAIVGAAGLEPTLAALRAGKLVALANKETLVMAGAIIKKQLGLGGTLVPMDSEHSAIWQCLQGEGVETVERVVLTASGGAFRDLSSDELMSVTPAQALAHPTWHMGPKITVDCATLMNKGLEVIEASILFDVDISQVEVTMHRESIVHSLVYFADSSVKAQLGLPDMRLPIQYALTHPERWPNSLTRLDLTEAGALHFASVDWDRYPCLRLAIEAGRQGGTYPAALCAADEVAVSEFLAGRIGFTDISHVIESTLDRHVSGDDSSLEGVLAADSSARLSALDLVRRGALPATSS
jgi:1-deoxy-D-xylulose-5-phosphate reductoisomerase